MKIAVFGFAAYLAVGVVLGRPATAQQAEDAPKVKMEPMPQAYQLPPDKLVKAEELGKIRTALDIGGSLWGLLVLWLLLRTQISVRVEEWLKGTGKRPRWVQGLMYFALLMLVLTVAVWPLDAMGHAASLAFGISVQGWGSWFGDELKSLGVGLVLATPVMLLFHWIVKVARKRYWLWAWLVCLPLLVLVIFVAPLIGPLFDKFEPLSEHHAALVAKLEEVVKRTGTEIPPDRMYLMLASEKTNGLNAYVTGMGATKRIVVWDTTAGRVPDDVVMFVFGHESGHYVLHHIQKMLAIFAVLLLALFVLTKWLGEWMVRASGARWGVTSLEQRSGFLVLLFALTILGLLVQPVTNAVSRHFEHEADVYGQEAIHGLVADPQKTAVAGFNALGAAWLEDPNPNELVEIWEYNHPSVQERATFAQEYDPWKDGGRGQFFNK